ncbi:MAG: hypothetical protein EHM24_33305 [Acidobacteria bacterium]|nr:MAG: hypothetical protein EHM24_33305 [Acidobacteriota bacterium]
MEEEFPLLTTEEAVAEVRRWLAAEGADPEQIFTGFGDTVIRYKDLIPLLERGAPDAELLRFAISRGRAMRRPARGARLFQIQPPPQEEP